MSAKKAVKFEEDPPRLKETEKAREADALLLDIDGFEGPIDILLELARKQKVDLLEVSILQLARQYLEFIERAREINLELAAEYLVMAAWLAYLKSRLLLPDEQEEDEPSAAEMAEALQFQLQRLEAMQQAAEKLMQRPQLGRQVFARGRPEGLSVKTETRWNVKLYDILKAYGNIQKRKEDSHYDMPEYRLMSMDDALSRMTRMLGRLPKKGMRSIWTSLESFMPSGIKDRAFGCSALASMFVAGLELAKQGKLEIKQDGLFRPIYLRSAGGKE